MLTKRIDVYKITVDIDDYPEDPRSFDCNLGRIVCLHRRYMLGDEHDYCWSDFSSWDELEDRIIKDEDVAVILPIYLMDHSGISISTRSTLFRMVDPWGWDWAQVGFIYATKPAIRQELGCKRVTQKRREWAEKQLSEEVKEYNKYIMGDIYSYRIESDKGEVVSMCGGFLDEEEALAEAEAEVNYLTKGSGPRKELSCTK